MIIFIVLAYLLIDSGINTKTKIYVNYKNDSKVIYKVYLNDTDKYLGMNDKYNKNLVDKINFDLTFTQNEQEYKHSQQIVDYINKSLNTIKQQPD